MTTEEISKYMKRITTMMWFSVVLWIVIIIMQFFIGIFTLFTGYGIATLAIMGYNIYGMINYIKTIKQIKKIRSLKGAISVLNYFEKSINSSLIFAGINLFLGGIIGVIGCIYDALIGIYVKEHLKMLRDVKLEEEEHPSWDGEYVEEKRTFF